MMLLASQSGSLWEPSWWELRLAAMLVEMLVEVLALRSCTLCRESTFVDTQSTHHQEHTVCLGDRGRKTPHRGQQLSSTVCLIQVLSLYHGSLLCRLA